MTTKPKSNAGRKPIADPLDKKETRYISLVARDWMYLDMIAMEHMCDTKDLVRGLITMLLDAPENLTIKFQDEDTNDQA